MTEGVAKAALNRAMVSLSGVGCPRPGDAADEGGTELAMRETTSAMLGGGLLLPL